MTKQGIRCEEHEDRWPGDETQFERNQMYLGEKIHKFRLSKNGFFHTSVQSPLIREEREQISFRGRYLRAMIACPV